MTEPEDNQEPTTGAEEPGPQDALMAKVRLLPKSPGVYLFKDAQGRVTAGQRQGLRFTVEEFIPDSRFPRSLRFEHPGNSGRLKILKMDFNLPYAQGAFETGFLRDFASKTWDEIQDILNNEG